MANSNYKKLRKNKIRQQLKEQQAKKVTEDLRESFANMTDEEVDEMAKRLSELLVVDKEEVKGEEEEE